MNKYFRSWKEFKDYLYADAFRYVEYHGEIHPLKWIKYYLRHPNYRYVFWLRHVQFTYGRNWMILWRMYAYLKLQNLRNKTCIQISPSIKIGKGFYIGHWGSIVINAREIGENVNIIQTCTIGVAYRGDRGGIPTIGNNVYIGSGTRIFGGITIGNNVAIGVNSVVTRDVQDNSVVVGSPAKVISMRGSEGYIYSYIDSNGVKHPRFKN